MARPRKGTPSACPPPVSVAAAVINTTGSPPQPNPQTDDDLVWAVAYLLDSLLCRAVLTRDEVQQIKRTLARGHHRREEVARG